MWRRLFRIFGAKIVATEDCDGEVRIRFVYSTPYGPKCRAICYSDGLCVTLNSDGTCSGKSYVERWSRL